MKRTMTSCLAAFLSLAATVASAQSEPQRAAVEAERAVERREAERQAAQEDAASRFEQQMELERLRVELELARSELERAARNVASASIAVAPVPASPATAPPSRDVLPAPLVVSPGAIEAARLVVSPDGSFVVRDGDASTVVLGDVDLDLDGDGDVFVGDGEAPLRFFSDGARTRWFNLDRTFNIASSPWGDMELVPMTEQLGRYFGTTEGLLVIRGPSDDTIGIEDGDVILAIGGRTPNSPEHATRILSSFEANETIDFSIVRQGSQRNVEYLVPEDETGIASGIPGLRFRLSETP